MCDEQLFYLRQTHQSPIVLSLPTQGETTASGTPANARHRHSVAIAQDRAATNETGKRETGMNILVACELSGVVRDAFRARGHNALSCDLEPSERPGPHYQGDIRDILYHGWDMLIAFPPCTHLCVSGARWFKEKRELQEQAIAFVRLLMNAPISRIAIENPVGIISSRIRKPDQIIQPWMFGCGETKATCLWLKGLPPLFSTEIVPGNVARIHLMAPSPQRSKERSRTYQGIADAMAAQWNFCISEVASC